MPSPRQRYPMPVTLAAAALAALLSWWLYLPELYTLCVTACRAIFPWFTWYDRYHELAEEILEYGPWAALPVPVVLTFLASRAVAARARPAWRPVDHRSRLRRWLPRGLVALALAPSAAALAALLILPLLSHGSGYYLTGGGATQRRVCSACHNPNRPYHFLKTGELWQVTVKRMRQLEGAEMSDGEAAQIVRYLAARTAYRDAWIFRARCLRCHDEQSLRGRPRAAGEWRQIIRRVARVSPFAHRLDWRKQLEQYAAQHLAAPADRLPAGAADKLLFEAACDGCHELGVSFDASPRVGSVESFVGRMVGKVPSMASADEQRRIISYIRGVRATSPPASQLKALFPHDQPLEVTW